MLLLKDRENCNASCCIVQRPAVAAGRSCSFWRSLIKLPAGPQLFGMALLCKAHGAARGVGVLGDSYYALLTEPFRVFLLEAWKQSTSVRPCPSKPCKRCRSIGPASKSASSSVGSARSAEMREMREMREKAGRVGLGRLASPRHGPGR